ncbi:MAG TPA: 50S ribosomal protein L22 [Campylobacterales bacterium]|nr:50S ribosomal protein L22 [Campylobacterales bacterium]
MSKAVLKFIRLSPNKARLVAREVQGMNGEAALAALEFTPNKAAGIIAKVIASAIANGGFEPEEVEIISCRIDKGPVLRRFKPRARGSASKILKPTSHIMVEVAEASAKKSAPKKVEKKEEVKKTETKKVEKKKEAPKAKAKADDLTKLKGVGKAYQTKLNDEGIFTYAQVADMNEKQIATMEEKYSFRGDFKETIEDAKQFVGKES